MSSPIDVQCAPIDSSRVREAATVLAKAFEDEPIITRMIPHGTPEREAKIADFFVWSILMTGLDTVDVALDVASDVIVGVALWEPPGHDAHTAAGEDDFSAVLAGIGPEGLATLDAYEAASEGKHPENAWHLVDIGTAPSARGLGVGGRLIRHRLDLIDAEGSLASLEATTRESGKLYERFGFAHMHTLSGVAEGTSVMWREPQQIPVRRS